MPQTSNCIYIVLRKKDEELLFSILMKKESILESNYLQLKKSIQNNNLKIDKPVIEYTGRYIGMLKEIKKKVIKYENKKDTRGYFKVNNTSYSI